MRKRVGNYPTNAGLTFPEGGDGRQFGCFRGFLCAACDASVSSRYWLCSKCTEPATSISDVWGTGILEPLYFPPPNCEAVTSLTSPSSFALLSESPSESWQRYEFERTSQRAGVMRRHSHSEFQLFVGASSLFLRCSRERGLSRRASSSILEVAHELHDKGSLIPGSTSTVMPQGECALPRDMRIVEARAQGSVLMDRDVPTVTVPISQAELRALYTCSGVTTRVAFTFAQVTSPACIPSRHGAASAWCTSCKAPSRGCTFFASLCTSMLSQPATGLSILGAFPL